MFASTTTITWVDLDFYVLLSVYFESAWLPVWVFHLFKHPHSAEARTSCQLAAQQPSKWAQSHSGCSCHNTGQLLSKLMLCTHNTSMCAHRSFLFALHIQQHLTKFTVCCFIFDQSWGVSENLRTKVLRAVVVWLVKHWRVSLSFVWLCVADVPCFPG